MKRALSVILTLALLATVPVLPAAAAEPAVFSPTVSPGETTAVTTLETGIPGLSLALGADNWSVGEAENVTSATGVAYPTFLTGKANPKVEEETGTYFSFIVDDAVSVGSLELTYRLNAGKAFYILDNGQAMPDYDGVKLDVSADTSATIIVEGGHTYTVYAKGSKLRLYGCAFQNVDPKEVFAQEIAAFPFERVRGTNADAHHVDEDLALVDSYESQFGSCDVAWTSSDPSVVDVDGTVNCQKELTTVTLTGHFSVQERREFAADVAFALTVLADPDDASAVAVAAQALTLGDLSSVKGNLDLPAKGKRGTAVTWQSSDPAVVGDDGKVYPAPNRDQSATLTATVKRGDAVETKEFPVTVAGIVPVTLDAWRYQDGAGNVRYTPVDGGSLRSVNLTCNDPNPDPKDVLTLTVYSANATVKAAKDFSVAEVFAGVPVGKSATLDVDLPVDATSTFELSAKNTKTGQALITPVKADDSLSEDAKVYVVGDSTASVYGDDRYPRKGWAQMLEGYFDGVEVVDLALSGRSSRSFKNEANYTTLKNSLKKGDYLIVQFGHNDDKADAYADPAADRFTQDSFQQSMLEYVELAWEKGAHPIIATSISRRKLSDEALEKYVAAARELADGLSVPCVDLYAATNGWINQVGVDAAQDLFNCVKPYDSRFMDYPWFLTSEFAEKGSTDDTHINLYGAQLISQWFVDGLKAQGLPLAAKVNEKQAPALPSYADATTVAVKTFADMNGHWAKPAAEYLATRGVLQGTDETHFTPDMLTSRAMVTTLVWRLAGEPSYTKPHSFADVPDAPHNNWYSAAVRWAFEQGIVDGYGDGGLLQNQRFSPDDPITREQLAAILWRYMTWRTGAEPSTEGTAILAYPDADAVSDWAKGPMAWAVEQGLLQGRGDGTLAPAATATRGETAVILQRLAALEGK